MTDAQHFTWNAWKIKCLLPEQGVVNHCLKVGQLFRAMHALWSLQDQAEAGLQLRIQFGSLILLSLFPSPLRENCPSINHYLRDPTQDSPLSCLLLSTCRGNEACHWNIKSTSWGEVRGPVCSGMNQSRLRLFWSLQITTAQSWTSGSASVPSEALGLRTAAVQAECPGSGLTAGETDLDLAPETILLPPHLPNILGIIITG